MEVEDYWRAYGASASPARTGEAQRPADDVAHCTQSK